MKRCPQCNRAETDDALAFCRVDGTALVSDSSAIGSEAGTVGSQPSSSEIETSILPHKTDANIDRETSRTTMLPAPPAASATLELTKPSRRKVRSPVMIVATAAIAITIVIAGYFYYSRKMTAAIESIAILPFVNQNNDPNCEYLSDGVPESIIHSLSQLPNLRVM